MSSDSAEAVDDTGEHEARQNAADETREDLLAQVELLTEENRRLRGEYVRARQSTYRRTALGLFAVGMLALLGALAFPDVRRVLLALSGTGLFAGVLTYYVTPDRFITAETGERVYAALSATGEELIAELGLQDDRVYAPASGTNMEFAAVRLFVPQRPDYTVPAPTDLDSLFVVGDGDLTRGVALPPTGGALYYEFETTMAEGIADDIDGLAVQLADALAEGFELVESAAADADPEGGRVSVEVAGSAYGAVGHFDHPVASFLAVGLAANLDVAVRLDVITDRDGPADYLVTCEWDPDGVEPPIE